MNEGGREREKDEEKERGREERGREERGRYMYNALTSVSVTVDFGGSGCAVVDAGKTTLVLSTTTDDDELAAEASRAVLGLDLTTVSEAPGLLSV